MYSVLHSTVNCTVGTYLRKTTGTCEDCPIGTYQEFDAQEKCYKCPQNTSTLESRTEKSSSCLGNYNLTVTVERCEMFSLNFQLLLFVICVNLFQY